MKILINQTTLKLRNCNHQKTLLKKVKGKPHSMRRHLQNMQLTKVSFPKYRKNFQKSVRKKDRQFNRSKWTKL